MRVLASAGTRKLYLKSNVLEKHSLRIILKHQKKKNKAITNKKHLSDVSDELTTTLEYMLPKYRGFLSIC